MDVVYYQPESYGEKRFRAIRRQATLFQAASEESHLRLLEAGQTLGWVTNHALDDQNRAGARRADPAARVRSTFRWAIRVGARRIVRLRALRWSLRPRVLVGCRST